MVERIINAVKQFIVAVVLGLVAFCAVSDVVLVALRMLRFVVAVGAERVGHVRAELMHWLSLW